MQKQKPSSIPALKDASGVWHRDSKSKAQILAETFSSKCSLPEAEVNSYTEIIPVDIKWDDNREKILTVKAAERVLLNLKEDSGTGPDLLPARTLKKCATELALPVYLLTMAILGQGSWPSSWGKHWVAAIYKKKSVYDPSNYRRVHVAAQLAKVIERLLGLFLSQC